MLRTCDCEVFEARHIAFSDAEMEEVSKIIRDYKEKKRCQKHLQRRNLKK